MKKGLLFVLLISLLLASFFALLSCSNNDNEVPATSDEYFRFNLLSNNTYEIEARYADMPPKTVIPKTYQGKSVTTIAENGFEARTSMDEIVIPSSITSIKRNAFKDCSGLTAVFYQGELQNWCSISFDDGANPLLFAHNLFIGEKNITTGILDIDNTISSISSYAFAGCNNISQVNLSKSIKDIGYSAFLNCNNPPVYYDGDVADWCAINGLMNLFNKGACVYIQNTEYKDLFSGEIVIPDGVSFINNYAFYNCAKLTSVSLPDSVKKIGIGAFCRCSELKDILFSNNLTDIEQNAFSDCVELERVLFPNTLTYIGGAAFSSCEKLKEITLADSVSLATNNNPFLGCSGIKRLRGSVTNVATIARSCNSNSFTVEITSGNSIRDMFFWGATGLTSITIPTSITRIGSDAFGNCYNLKTIYYEGDYADWFNIDGLFNIMFCHQKDSIFMTEKNLYLKGKLVSGEITIPEGISRVPKYAFAACMQINTITLPSTVLSIEEGAFSYCYGLKELYLAASLKTINLYAFYGCSSLAEIHFDGTIAKWDSVEKKSFSSKTHTIKCSDGDVLLR